MSSKTCSPWTRTLLGYPGPATGSQMPGSRSVPMPWPGCACDGPHAPCLSRQSGWEAEERSALVEEHEGHYASNHPAIRYRRLDDGIFRCPCCSCQSNSCKAVQVLQAWVSGSIGTHGRRGQATGPWSRKPWSKRKA